MDVEIPQIDNEAADATRRLRSRHACLHPDTSDRFRSNNRRRNRQRQTTSSDVTDCVSVVSSRYRAMKISLNTTAAVIDMMELVFLRFT